jgi:hypothetical protein
MGKFQVEPSKAETNTNKPCNVYILRVMAIFKSGLVTAIPIVIVFNS